jgi:hypothetical protein
MSNLIENVIKASTTGTFAGNDAANRAIPHGLGRTPSLVVMTNGTQTAAHIICGQSGTILYTSVGVKTVTAMDAVNFYVGEASNYTTSGNAAGTTYIWSAC